VADAPPQARLMREEAFGPVVVVQSVADVDAGAPFALMPPGPRWRARRTSETAT